MKIILQLKRINELLNELQQQPIEQKFNAEILKNLLNEVSNNILNFKFNELLIENLNYNHLKPIKDLLEKNYPTHETSQYIIACIYDLGSDYEKKQAINWYKKSAEQGYIKAQYSLAVKYYTGEFIEKSFKQAVTLYKQAAEQENNLSLTMLVNEYSNVNKSYEEASKWFTLALKQGFFDIIPILLFQYNNHNDRDFIENCIIANQYNLLQALKCPENIMMINQEPNIFAIISNILFNKGFKQDAVFYLFLDTILNNTQINEQNEQILKNHFTNLSEDDVLRRDIIVNLTSQKWAESDSYSLNFIKNLLDNPPLFASYDTSDQFNLARQLYDMKAQCQDLIKKIHSLEELLSHYKQQNLDDSNLPNTILSDYIIEKYEMMQNLSCSIV